MNNHKNTTLIVDLSICLECLFLLYAYFYEYGRQNDSEATLIVLKLSMIFLNRNETRKTKLPSSTKLTQVSNRLESPVSTLKLQREFAGQILINYL